MSKRNETRYEGASMKDSQEAIDALADAALGQVEFIRQCRVGRVDLKCERPLTKQERNHEQYLRRKREHPDYYTREARRRRAADRNIGTEAQA
jgi:hypothetical protein